MLERTFITTLRANPELVGSSGIVIAVSGGMDSMALLSLCSRFKHYLPKSVYVATLNHGIRVDASEDIQMVVQQSKAAGFPVFASRLPARDQSGEESLRFERRKFLIRVAQDVGADRIWTAHTADDVVETMVMNMGRGSGLVGISSMRLLDGIWGKPLIFATKSEIENYVLRHEVAFREDTTNKELVYTRNRIRHLLIPYWSEVVGRDVRRTLFESWAVNITFADFVREQSQAVLEQLLVEKSATMLKLKRKEFLRASMPTKAVILYSAVRTIGAQVASRRQIEEAINCIRNVVDKSFGGFVLTVDKRTFTLEVTLRDGDRDS
ncbi:tRNA lysidine(34) synthetase TilS [Coprothermobacteraceae bacterium]|nr:tRNA lysidine(34) synthetase TilS [Coprothermobacteraceae bacterium]